MWWIIILLVLTLINPLAGLAWLALAAISVVMPKVE